MPDREKRRRILVIEDEREMADLVAQILEKEGYDVDVAYDGEVGLNKVRETKPDAVLLDIMLPKIDGRDLLKKVKEEESTKKIPFIILSAKTEQWDRDLGLELGADEYIEKPLEIVKLLRKVKDVVDKTALE